MSRRLSLTTFLVVGLGVATFLALFVSPHSSASPDGLEKVAADNAIDTEVRDHPFAGGPLADYSVRGMADKGLSTGVAGVAGVAVTFAVAGGLAGVTRSLRHRDRAGVPPA
jgi:cobalt/nickel transport system permease protein